MPSVFTLKKGLDIPLLGLAPKTLVKAPPPQTISLSPTDFCRLTPKLLVKEGDRLAAGTPVFADKYRPHILFTTPLGGLVRSIVRGEKRKLLNIHIEVNDELAPLTFNAGKPQDLTREQIVDTLLQSGCWPNLRQRPYGIIANPADTPKAIFISAFDTAPLAPDLDFILTGQEAELQYGIDILNKLAPGGIYWNIHSRTLENAVARQVKNVRMHTFKGPHPSGNVGVQIHHIAPLSKGETIWTIDPQAVIIMGRLFATGLLDTRKTVALTGSCTPQPGYISMLPGYPLYRLTQIGVFNPRVRYISGNCLSGENVGYNGSLGFYHQQITLLPEGNHQEFLGWAKILRSKTFSISRSYLSWLCPKKQRPLDTNTNGGERAFVMTDLYAKVLPMDIYPVHLLKAILAGDIDKMEALGIYEVVEEDFALCEFVCPSKINMQEIISNGIDLMIKEMS
ncbi:MAG: Na(+)-translocating NADH-quinone reductase subunit A [Bacteroidales bacterium]|nr:Na(+)-translocating NADH-quinone reductase subunit A [Bacteroidales bacterium]